MQNNNGRDSITGAVSFKNRGTAKTTCAIEITSPTARIGKRGSKSQAGATATSTTVLAVLDKRFSGD